MKSMATQSSNELQWLEDRKIGHQDSFLSNSCQRDIPYRDLSFMNQSWGSQLQKTDFWKLIHMFLTEK